MERICEIHWNGKKISKSFGRGKVLHLYFFDETPFVSTEVLGNTLPGYLIFKTIFGAKIISLQSKEKESFFFWKKKLKNDLNEYVISLHYQTKHLCLFAAILLIFSFFLHLLLKTDPPFFTEAELFEDINYYLDKSNVQQARASFVLLKELYPDLALLELIDGLLLKQEGKSCE